MKSLALKISPFQLFVITALAILAAEGLSHFMLYLLPPLSEQIRNFLDLFMVLSFMTLIFIFSFKPIKDQWNQQLWSNEEIRLNAERLQFALEGSQAGLWDWDVKTGKAYFSPRWEEMLGYRPGEITPSFQIWVELLHPQDRENTVNKLMNHLAGETDHYETEFRMRAKDGSWVWIHDRGQVVAWDEKTGTPLRAVGTHSDITGKKNAENKVQHLSRKLLITAEEERKKLASELHDEFGQSLVALKLGLEMLSSPQNSTIDAFDKQTDRLIGLTNGMIQEVRDFCTRLRPTILDDMGFEPALGWLRRQFVTELKEIELRIEGLNEQRLPPEVEVTIYRLCQEGLNNIVKHARANRASIFVELKDSSVYLTIEDNGIGFDTEAKKNQKTIKGSGLGIIGMRERVSALSGEFEIRRGTESGTLISVNLPFQESEA